METRITSDHKKIRQWAEERDARPACYKCSNGNSLLLFCFPGETETAVSKLSWEDFFKKFEELNLAFLYQEKNNKGEKSRFNSFISKEVIKSRLMKKTG